MNPDEFEIPGEGATWLAEVVIREMTTDGIDCASVELLVRMARATDASAELEEFAEVLGIMSKGHPEKAGEVLRIALSSSSEPDYTMAAGVLSQMATSEVLKIYPHLISYAAGGPDCYDLSMILGHMQYSGKAKQAAQVLMGIYLDDTPQGQNYKSLVPCMLGTLVDNSYTDSASDLVVQLILSQSQGQPAASGDQPAPDYVTGGWCLAQHVFFGRPDWAAAILTFLRQQRPGVWYNEVALLESVASWGGENYRRDILSCLAGGRPGPPGGGGGVPRGGQQGSFSWRAQ